MGSELRAMFPWRGCSRTRGQRLTLRKMGSVGLPLDYRLFRFATTPWNFPPSIVVEEVSGTSFRWCLGEHVDSRRQLACMWIGCCRRHLHGPFCPLLLRMSKMKMNDDRLRNLRKFFTLWIDNTGSVVIIQTYFDDYWCTRSENWISYGT